MLNAGCLLVEDGCWMMVGRRERCDILCWML